MSLSDSGESVIESEFEAIESDESSQVTQVKKVIHFEEDRDEEEDGHSFESDESMDEPMRLKQKDFYGGVDEGHNIDLSDDEEAAELLEEKEALKLQKKIYSHLSKEDCTSKTDIMNNKTTSLEKPTPNVEKTTNYQVDMSINEEILKNSIEHLESFKNSENDNFIKLKQAYIINSLFYNYLDSSNSLKNKVFTFLEKLHFISQQSETISLKNDIQNPLNKKTTIDSIHNESIENDSKRMATKEIIKNRGLTPTRRRIDRNSRVKHKQKYKKAIGKRRGQVKSVVKEFDKYTGERHGIRKNVSHSVRLN